MEEKQPQQVEMKLTALPPADSSELVTREHSIQVVVGNTDFISEEIDMQFDWFKRHTEYDFAGYASKYTLSYTWFNAGYNHDRQADGVISTAWVGERPPLGPGHEVTAHPYHETTDMKFIQVEGQEGSVKYQIVSETSVPAEEGKFPDGRLRTKAYTPERVAKIRELLLAQGIVAEVNELEDSTQELVMEAGDNVVVANLGGYNVEKYDRVLRKRIFAMEDLKGVTFSRIALKRIRSNLEGQTADEAFYQSTIDLRMISKKDWEEVKATGGSFKDKGFDYGDKTALDGNLKAYAKTYGAFLNALYGEKGIQFPQTDVNLKGNEFQPPKYPPGTLVA